MSFTPSFTKKFPSPLDKGTATAGGSINLWDPLDEWDSTALELWLDASLADWKTGDAQDYITLNLSPDPDTASQWDDRSGNENDAAQATEANQPVPDTATYDERVMGFAGGIDKMSYTQIACETIAALVKKDAVANRNTLITKTAQTTPWGMGLSGADSGSGQDTAKVSATAKPPTGVAQAWRVNVNTYDNDGTDNLICHRDGVAGDAVEQDSANWNMNSLADYAGFQFDGDLIMVVILNVVATADQIEKLEGWMAWILNTQYGDSTVVDALPAEHAYKAAAPQV